MDQYPFFMDQQEAVKLRLDLALRLTNLSIEDFCQMQDLSRSTLFAWKNGRKPLTLKGMERLAKALENEGVFCTADWLLQGKGISPRTSQEVSQGLKPLIEQSNYQLFDETLDQEVKILQEIEAFRQINTQAEVLFVTDDAVTPLVKPGDYVGGLRLEDQDLHKAFNKICIVRLSSHQLLLRYVSEGTEDNLYTLSCLNPRTTVERPVIYDTNVTAIAPLVWIRYTQK